jgi:hypothetical protein
MTRIRTFGTRAAFGGLTAAVALMTATPAARADEVADLRANQELLQRRVDQLAQSGNVGPGPAVLAPTTGGPVGVQMTGGSFPRSFLIPGTDTSIRVGGEIRLVSQFFITGGNPNENPQSTNSGITGQLNNIPLKGTALGSTQDINRGRSHNVLDMSPSQSKMSIETRTPTAWGEARSFLEFDFSGGVGESQRPQATSDNLIPRLRYAYGTLGPLLFGQANSNFNDSDAAMESLEFGGLIGNTGPSRVPQIRWTEPLGGWGLLGALSVSAESPETDIWAPAGGGANGTGVFGANASNTVALQSPTGASLAALLAAQPFANTTPGNPLKNTAPEMVAAWYIPQPWGHVDFAAVVRPLLRIQTPFGRGIDRTFTGYGFAFSGDVKPGWFGWDRDFFTWQIAGGEAMGRYLYAGSGSSVSLVSNLSGNSLIQGNTLIRPARGWEGNISYRHVWTPELRSNIGAGIWHLDVPGLNGAVCPAASHATAGGGCNLNKELVMGKVNLIWQPISFVDIGLEYNYGRRVVLSGQSGDEHVVVNRFRLRF